MSGDGYGHKKCHYEYDTVYETVYHTIYKKACSTHYNKKCHVEYDHTYETKYHPKCHTSYHPVCHTFYATKYKDECETNYHKSCKKTYTVKYEHEYKKKCHVYHDEQCHGYGYHKKCQVYPREECTDVPVKVPVKVPLGKPFNHLCNATFLSDRMQIKLTLYWFSFVKTFFKVPNVNVYIQSHLKPSNLYSKAFDRQFRLKLKTFLQRSAMTFPKHIAEKSQSRSHMRNASKCQRSSV